jgi:peroxiredoxin|tara:strand:+ start:855 stop:1433 length:579 start_codon:yes stop_codon:yes gene_type:complete
MIAGFKIPHVTFKTRVRDETIEGPNPYRWQDMTTDDYFKGKRVVLFSLPGAFTPTCSTYQLPGFEENYNKICEMGIDDIYCMSVNDAFVMNKWAKDQCIERVKVIPDGSGDFTRFMGMLIGKYHLGFGLRSWRYMAIVNDGVVEQWWQEPGINNEGLDDDPYGETAPENCLAFLKTHSSTFEFIKNINNEKV